jgi:hypothetical protein
MIVNRSEGESGVLEIARRSLGDGQGHGAANTERFPQLQPTVYRPSPARQPLPMQCC